MSAQKFLNKLYQKRNAEIQHYVENYYESCLDAFPEPVPFSSDARDLQNTAMDLWLAMGHVAIDSDNQELQEIYLDALKESGLLKQDKFLSAA